MPTDSGRRHVVPAQMSGATPPDAVAPVVPAGEFLRTARRARSHSQWELAERSGVARATIERIEGGRGSGARYDTVAGLLAALGFALLAVDARGRALRARDPSEQIFDRSGRRMPSHLRIYRTPGYFAHTDFDDRAWWGWGRIAWSDYSDVVPEWTFWRRRTELPTLDDGWARDRDVGRVWDDAT